MKSGLQIKGFPFPLGFLIFFVHALNNKKKNWGGRAGILGRPSYISPCQSPCHPHPTIWLEDGIILHRILNHNISSSSILRIENERNCWIVGIVILKRNLEQGLVALIGWLASQPKIVACQIPPEWIENYWKFFICSAPCTSPEMLEFILLVMILLFTKTIKVRRWWWGGWRCYVWSTL